MFTSGRKFSSKLEKEKNEENKKREKEESLEKWLTLEDDVLWKRIEREKPAGILPFSKQVIQCLRDWYLMVKFLQGTQALVFSFHQDTKQSFNQSE